MFRIYIDFECGHEYRGFVYETADGKGEMICEEDVQTLHITQNVKWFETREKAQEWIDANKDELDGATVKIL